jgi:hypothetical protein
MSSSISAGMRRAAASLLAGLGDRQRAAAQAAFSDDTMRRWIEYRPQRRPGACLGDLDPASRKAAHKLLATGLSPHAYAQAMTIVALEEVLDRAEGWRRGRHSNDYWVIVFGDPQRDDIWGWRFEGHHLSVTMTVDGERVFPTPVFLGANPAAITYTGRTVVRPLAPEEDVARELLAALPAAARREAIVSGTAPSDIRSSVRPRAPESIPPLGVRAERLDARAREILGELVAVYLRRLPPELAEAESARVDAAGLYFAWEGATEPGPGRGHYYRIQAPDLLIEYDNTDNDANHAHTVLRRPDSDFGGDTLAAHRSLAHGE